MNPSTKSPTVNALFGQTQKKSPSVSLVSSKTPSQKAESEIKKQELNDCCSKTVLRCFRLALDRWHPKKPDTDPYKGREYTQLCEVYKTVFGEDPEEF